MSHRVVRRAAALAASFVVGAALSSVAYGAWEPTKPVTFVDTRLNGVNGLKLGGAGVVEFRSGQLIGGDRDAAFSTSSAVGSAARNVAAASASTTPTTLARVSTYSRSKTPPSRSAARCSFGMSSSASSLAASAASASSAT